MKDGLELLLGVVQVLLCEVGQLGAARRDQEAGRFAEGAQQGAASPLTGQPVACEGECVGKGWQS